MSITEYEEYTCLTWPALETMSYDGWLLRFSGGVTNRSNAVYPLYPSTYDLERKLAYCADAYRERGLRAVYRITTGIHPLGLDARLAAEGYTAYEHSVVMVRGATASSERPGHAVSVEPEMTDAWLNAYFAFQPRWAGQRETFAAMMRSSIGQRSYASITIEGRIAAVGTLSRVRRIAAVYNMATDPTERRRGLATSLLNALIEHASRIGVRGLFLHVSAENEAALRLYNRVGFVESYRYCYRAAPAPSATMTA